MGTGREKEAVEETSVCVCVEKEISVGGNFKVDQSYCVFVCV